MKKTILRSALLAVASIGLMAGGAMAQPTLVSGFDWVDSDYWSANSGDSDLMQLTFSSSSDFDFGIYNIDDAVTPTSIIDSAFIFQNDGMLSTATLSFSFDGSDWDLNINKGGITTTYDNFGTSFGFFAAFPSGGDKFYTDTQFNADGNERLLIAYNEAQGNALIYGEATSGDTDFDDLTVSAIDISPIPEPATMLLFGTGLAGLAGYRRKKSQKA